MTSWKKQKTHFCVHIWTAVSRQTRQTHSVGVCVRAAAVESGRTSSPVLCCLVMQIVFGSTASVLMASPWQQIQQKTQMMEPFRWTLGCFF